MKGFSRANMLYMRAFAEAWPDEAIVQQLVGQLPWALRDSNKPIGVSEYLLTEILPHELEGSLPTIEQLEAELAGDEEA